MDLVSIYAAVILTLNLINAITISVKVSEANGLKEGEQKLANMYSKSVVISFFVTLPIYLRAVGLI